MSTSTLPRKSRRTARHDDGITPPSSARVKQEIEHDSLSLLEVWLAVRKLDVRTVIKESGAAAGSFYNLLRDADSLRESTAEALAGAISRLGKKRLTTTQVLALARTRLTDPDRASDEIAEALEAALE